MLWKHHPLYLIDLSDPFQKRWMGKVVYLLNDLDLTQVLFG